MVVYFEYYRIFFVCMNKTPNLLNPLMGASESVFSTGGCCPRLPAACLVFSQQCHMTQLTVRNTFRKTQICISIIIVQVHICIFWKALNLDLCLPRILLSVVWTWKIQIWATVWSSSWAVWKEESIWQPRRLSVEVRRSVNQGKSTGKHISD